MSAERMPPRSGPGAGGGSGRDGAQDGARNGRGAASGGAGGTGTGGEPVKGGTSGNTGGKPGARRSGRFPERTTDTARPEGGGRAVGGDHIAPARQWPLLSVLAGVALGLLITAAGAFRAGLITIGLCLLIGGALRWLLPSVGMLAVRSRFTDVITYSVLGATIVLLALMAPPKPILHVPFLDAIVHFAVR